MKQKRKANEEIVTGYRRSLEEAQTKVNQAEGELSKLMNDPAAGLLRNLAAEGGFPSQKSVGTLLRDLNSQEDTMRAAPVRAAVKPHNYPGDGLLFGVRHVGVVVDLGFADRPDTARLLSWAAQSTIDAVVVEQSSAAHTLYDRGVKAWSLDQMVRYKPSKNRCGTRSWSR